jgi:hypothetical protein
MPQDACLGFINYSNLASVHNTKGNQSKKQVYILHMVLLIVFKVSEAISA